MSATFSMTLVIQILLEQEGCWQIWPFCWVLRAITKAIELHASVYSLGDLDKFAWILSQLAHSLCQVLSCMMCEFLGMSRNAGCVTGWELLDSFGFLLAPQMSTHFPSPKSVLQFTSLCFVYWLYRSYSLARAPIIIVPISSITLSLAPRRASKEIQSQFPFYVKVFYSHCICFIFAKLFF